MKTVITLVALSLISAVSFAKSLEAAAAEARPYLVYQGAGPAVDFMSQKTRAEVVAELKASQARHDYVIMGDALVPRSDFMSVRTPQQVRMEAAMASHSFNRVLSQEGSRH